MVPHANRRSPFSVADMELMAQYARKAPRNRHSGVSRIKGRRDWQPLKAQLADGTPKDLAAVLEAHGEVAFWNKMSELALKPGLRTANTRVWHLRGSGVDRPP